MEKLPDVDTDEYCGSLRQSPNPSRLDGLTTPCSSMTHTIVLLLPHPPTSGVTHPEKGCTLFFPSPGPSLLFQWLSSPNKGSSSLVLKMAQEEEHFTAQHQMMQPGFGFHQPNSSTQPSVLGSPNWTKPNSFSSARWLYFTSWNPPLIDATQWKYYDEKTLQIQDIKTLEMEDQALCQESGEDQDSKPHTPSTPTTSLPESGVWFKPTPAFKTTSPQSGGTGSRSSGDAWSFCFTQKAKTKSVAYLGSCEEGKKHCSLLQHNFRAFSPTLGPPAPCERAFCISSSPGAHGAEKSQHALPHRRERVWTGGSLWESCTEYEMYSSAEPCSNWRLNACLPLSNISLSKYLLIRQITETETT